MVLLLHHGKFVRLVQDISMAFNEKAFLVIRDNSLLADFLPGVDVLQLVQEAVPSDRYFISLGRERINNITNECTHHLAIRNNGPKNFISHAARRFLASTREAVPVPPPMCAAFGQ